MCGEFNENNDEQYDDCSFEQTDPEYNGVLDEYDEDELCNEEKLNNYYSAEDEYARIDKDLQLLEETKEVLEAERENMDIYTADDMEMSDSEIARINEKIDILVQQKFEAETKLRETKKGTIFEAEEETYNRTKMYESDMDWDANDPKKLEFDRYRAECARKANLHFRDIINDL